MGFNLKKVAEAMSGLGGSNSDAVDSTAQEASTGAGSGAERDADFSANDAAASGSASSATGDSSSTKGGAEDAAVKEIARLETEVAEFKDKYLRSLAEFENYKKRAIKERSDILKYQGERVLGDLLEVVDSFERALEHGGADAAKVLEGVKLIHKQCLDLLQRWDVRGESAIDQQFDPYRHKAISQAPVPGKSAGTVIGELKKVYFYKDKLLRFGEVVVATEPPTAAAEAPQPPENESK